MSELRLALLWHQHQPYYRDLLTGAVRMPWVRLHGTKDYYGMARLLLEAGGAVKATINLVPSLVEQLLAAARGEGEDEHLSLSRRPPADLTAEERARALDLFFMADHDRMIRPWPRYGELLAKRRLGRFPARQVAPEFTAADLRDLQVWANLAWFHRTLLASDGGLRALTEKGRDFTEADKEHVLARQRAVLGEVLPLHRRLADEGIVELSASPACHPILPLLVDMESAREARPATALPARRVPLADDARTHLARAVRCHEEVFGRRPRGLWPSEGSVSEAILPLVHEAGFTWLASDEEVLGASLGRPVSGSADLYRSWRVGGPGRELAMVFRDHRLSDLVGFAYKGMDGATAAADFLGRLRNIRERHPGEDLLVPVILDGENAWEHYPEGGLPFLRALYAGLAASRDIRTVRLGDEVAERPPRAALPRLRAGSWINADFAVWIGHPDDVRSWDYLFRVREDLERFIAAGGVTPEAAERARDCLLVAEGSDWNWWYGEDHTSGQDEAFDELYRLHLANVYRALSREPPPFLAVPVPAGRRRGTSAAPADFLRVSVDGRETSFFEWLAAGRYRAAPGESVAGPGGAMRRGGLSVLTGLHFGFDAHQFFLRADLVPEWREALTAEGGPTRFVARFFEPVAAGIEIDDLLAAHLNPRVGSAASGTAAAGEILEIACPFAALALTAGARAAFAVELWRGDVLVERLPGGETVWFDVPSEDFQTVRWRV